LRLPPPLVLLIMSGLFALLRLFSMLLRGPDDVVHEKCESIPRSDDDGSDSSPPPRRHGAGAIVPSHPPSALALLLL